MLRLLKQIYILEVILEMTSVILKNTVNQIKIFIETMVYNGLDLATKENIRQIEFFLQNSSQVETYRLAISLRYLHVEIKRFLEQNQAFSMERYVFFLCNCWLLSRAFLSQELDNKGENKELMQILSGKPSQKKILKPLKLRIVGLEKVFLEGSLFGIILYLVSLKAKTRSSIFKWSIMQTPKGKIDPESLLRMAISENKIKILDLLYKEFYALNLAYSEEEMLIHEIKKIPPCFSSNEKDPFPIKRLEKYHYNVENLFSLIMKIQLTPFDLPTRFLSYLLIKNVEIVDFFKEVDDGRNNRIPVYVFKISHDSNYPLFIRIQEKSCNQVLISNLQNFKDKKEKIKNLFGKLLIERGQLSIFPLSVYNDSEVFICLSEKFPKPRQEYKVLYKKDKS